MSIIVPFCARSHSRQETMGGSCTSSLTRPWQLLLVRSLAADFTACSSIAIAASTLDVFPTRRLRTSTRSCASVSSAAELEVLGSTTLAARRLRNETADADAARPLGGAEVSPLPLPLLMLRPSPPSFHWLLDRTTGSHRRRRCCCCCCCCCFFFCFC